jgi:hypothetical protein
MVEMTWTSLKIGGALPENMIDELAELIEERFHDQSEDPKHLIVTALHDGTAVEFTGNVNYGNPEEVVAFCHEHDLTYWHWSDSGPEWSSNIVIWNPAMQDKISDVPADSQSYEPLVEMKTLMQFENLQDLRAFALAHTADAVPPLTYGPPKLTEDEKILSTTEGA